MEAPFPMNSWEGVTGAIYTGFGHAEAIWLLIAMAMVVLAIWKGWRHEKHAYEAVDRKH